jgi:hypothetical protein
VELLPRQQQKQVSRVLHRLFGGADTKDRQVSDGSGKNRKRGTHGYGLGGRGGLSSSQEQKMWWQRKKRMTRVAKKKKNKIRQKKSSEKKNSS